VGAWRCIRELLANWENKQKRNHPWAATQGDQMPRVHETQKGKEKDRKDLKAKGKRPRKKTVKKLRVGK